MEEEWLLIRSEDTMEINCQNLFGQEMVVSSPRQTVQDINLILMFGGEDINNRFYVEAKTKTG